jgi:hypothetical protein
MMNAISDSSDPIVPFPYGIVVSLLTRYDQVSLLHSVSISEFFLLSSSFDF